MRLGPLNLTWWRKRPSVHVADYPKWWEHRPGAVYPVTDISAIISLDPVDSPFMTMMSKLSRAPISTTFAEEDAPPVGSFVYREGKIQKVIAVRHSDDWFEDHVEVLLRPPWDDKPPTFQHHWLEDELMPRIITDPALRRGTAIITNITG